MNTVCQLCDRVVLKDYSHDCPEDGVPIEVRQTTPGHLRLDMLEHYGRTPADAKDYTIRVSPKPVDSAMRSIPLVIQTLKLAGEYYGTNIVMTNEASHRRHLMLHNQVMEAMMEAKRTRDRDFAQFYMGDFGGGWRPSWKFRVAEWILNRLVRPIERRLEDI